MDALLKHFFFLQGVAHNPQLCRLQKQSFLDVFGRREAREPHTPAGRFEVRKTVVRWENSSISPHSPSPFLHSLQTFRSNGRTVAYRRSCSQKNTTVLQSNSFENTFRIFFQCFIIAFIIKHKLKVVLDAMTTSSMYMYNNMHSRDLLFEGVSML